jgi:hypothetical protein
MSRESIYQKVIKLDVYVGGYCSDLYVEVTPETKEIVNAYEYKEQVTTFRNQVNKKMCFDIPFAYEPYWEKRALK